MPICASLIPTALCCAHAQDHRIHMSESDFVDMTRNGALCNAAGEIGAREFETIMRGEVITYLQVLLFLRYAICFRWLKCPPACRPA